MSTKAIKKVIQRIYDRTQDNSILLSSMYKNPSVFLSDLVLV